MAKKRRRNYNGKITGAIFKGLLKLWGVPFACNGICYIPPGMDACFTGPQGDPGQAGAPGIDTPGAEGADGPAGADGSFPFPDCPATGKHYLTCSTSGTYNWVEESIMPNSCLCKEPAVPMCTLQSTHTFDITTPGGQMTFEYGPSILGITQVILGLFDPNPNINIYRDCLNNGGSIAIDIGNGNKYVFSATLASSPNDTRLVFSDPTPACEGVPYETGPFISTSGFNSVTIECWNF